MSATVDHGGPLTDTDNIEGDDRSSLLAALVLALENWRVLVVLPLLCALIGGGVTYIVKPVYTARTTIMPPQQSPQSNALAALGSIATLATSAGGLRTSADLYGALLQSAAVEDKLVEQFNLAMVYEVDLQVDARLRLEKRTRVEIGKKDGLISLEVDDAEPKRAAEIAAAYVAGLRRVTSQLALTEAQQRRVFFETRMQKTRDALAEAQRALQSSGFSAGVLRAEPKVAAESYARLKAEVTAAELKLLALRDSFADGAPEVQRQAQQLSALRAQLARAEAQDSPQSDAEYISRYREFKYQESLFELFARQYELARTDEAREGSLIQVVDEASVPQKRSKPKRVMTVLLSFLAGVVLAAVFIAVQSWWRLIKLVESNAAVFERLRAALRAR